MSIRWSAARGAIAAALLMFACAGALGEAEPVELVLPASVARVEAEAFAGDAAIRAVTVPEGAVSIGDRAFWNCAALERVSLPASLESIGEDAFALCPRVALHGAPGSLAEQYAAACGIPFVGAAAGWLPESAHPYADGFDFTWTYVAGAGVESMDVTFSADTHVEADGDYIRVYDGNGLQIGRYTGGALAGQTLRVDGDRFQIRLESDALWGEPNAHYGFKITGVACRYPTPLALISITPGAASATAGEEIVWAVASEGGSRPVYGDYAVLQDGVERATGSVQRAADGALEIRYVPVAVGEYALRVSLRDSAGAVLPAQTGGAVAVAPSAAWPESAHPYANNFDYTWVYAAADDVSALRVTFSEDTRLGAYENDFIRIYAEDGTLLGEYGGKELAGQTLEIEGDCFRIRLTTDEYGQYYGFRIISIEQEPVAPLAFVSLAPSKSKVLAGETIAWTMHTEGGKRPVDYDYSIECAGETVASGTVRRPATIEYSTFVPGDYTLTVQTRDARGETLAAQASTVRVNARPETPAADFAFDTLSDGTVRITGYAGADTHVVIPAAIAGQAVRAIGAEAFRDNAALESVSLPDTLEQLGDGAFRGCLGLRSLRLNEGLTRIGAYAFYGCASLESVHIPDSVNTIREYAFSQCAALRQANYPLGWRTAGEPGHIFEGTALAEMQIPEGVTTIPNYAFSGCGNFTHISFPASLRTICGYAFNNCGGLVSISLPEGLETIGQSAFSSCEALTSVRLPDSVTCIEDYAFGWCVNLKDINYPMSWKSAGMEIFTYTAITTMVVPEGVTSIPYYAFYNFTSLQTAVLPSGLDEIGAYAFSGCRKLETVSLPDNVKEIGNGAFESCTGLVDIQLSAQLETIGWQAFQGCTGLSRLRLPDSVATIRQGAFRNCANLADVNYPLGWKVGGSEIFVGTALTTMEIPQGVTAIADYAFMDCANFTSILLPEGLDTIGVGSFLGCTGLTSMRIPDSVTTVGLGAFYKCSQLSNINYPMGWTTVRRDGYHMDEGYRCDEGIFEGTALTAMEIPEGVTTIPDYAFTDCANFTSILLPEGLDAIGIEAFANCTGLASMHIPDSVTSIGMGAFYGCSQLSGVNYPVGWTSVRADDYWHEGIFAGTALTTLDIPEGVTAIPEYAFHLCPNFTTMRLPGGLRSIGNFAFFECDALVRVWIPESTVEIGYQSFDYSELLTIHGVAGSYAETYARQNNIPFSAEPLP